MTSSAVDTRREPVTDPACWTGAEMAARTDWAIDTDATAIADLETMAQEIRARIGDDANGLLHLQPEEFDLGRFAPAIATAKQDLKDGRGFVLLRGLPVDRWDRLTSAIVYWAIGRHVGRPLSNNPQGDMLGHVADLGKDLDHPQHRGYQTNATMFYHVDQCDVVGLLCLQKSKSGGASKIASSIAVHNEMVRRHPDLADALRQPLCWGRMGEIGPGQHAWYESPLFCYPEGRLSVSAGFKHVEKGHALPETPDLPDETRRAMLVLNDIAEELHLAMDFEPGDIQLLNNHVMLHTRTEFEDWLEPERRRHLWRLWLNVPGIRPYSPYYENWRDGIWAPEGAHHITLTA